MNTSCIKMWRDWCAFSDSVETTDSNCTARQFTDHLDADSNASLILQGKKRASTSLLLEYQFSNKDIPKVGELNIITDSEGEAQCIIRITKVDVISFSGVTEELAKLESTAENALEDWKNTHRTHFKNYLDDTENEFCEDIPVVFQQFVVIYPLDFAD